MRCKEVIRRLNEGSIVDGEMQQHLANCPSCAREAVAAGVLISALAQAKAKTDDEVTPIAHVKSRVTAEFGKERSKMSGISERIKARPGIATGTVIVVGLLLVSLLVPFSYETTVGYNATFAGIDAEKALPVSAMVKAVSALGYENASVSMSVSEDGVSYTVANLLSGQAVKEVRAALVALVGFNGEPSIEPIREKTSGTLYAQVMDRLVEIEIDATGLSDPELEEAIAAELAAHGATASEVTVTTTPDGQKQIDIDLGEVEGAEGGGTEATWQIKIQNGMVGGAGCENLNLDGIEGMTDAEAKAFIEDQLMANGVTNPNVTVMTNADGQRRIAIGCDQ